jgi:NADH-quinone oxidoreductase subunit J
MSEALAPYLESLQYPVFLLFSLTMIGGALYVFFTKNILYGAYGLLVSLLSVAGLFLVAGAEFPAVSQVMVYVGGVLVLVIFGIMLSARGQKKEDALKVDNVNNVISLLLATLMAGGFGLLCWRLFSDSESVDYEPVEMVKSIGFTLMTGQVLILEIIGLLLLLVLIGASYIAKK